MSVTGMLDVKLKIFDSSERMVLNNSRVLLYCGSKEVLTKVILMDRDALSAGEEAYVQFRLEEPIAVRRGDRFIIRFYSPIITIGGGQILDAVPEKHKRNRENVLEGFRMLESGNISSKAALKAGKVDYLLYLTDDTHGSVDGKRIIMPIYSLERFHF